ncbi:nucleotidyltransferase family protein [Rugamonas apoptosis]|uniref:Nucleotidyltransferase family protein n=1 Tax=Rugamonas apoptosis TaxID=2758570 RepID=A0A7W2FEV6_9BURK|nr:nucleotidyltransferase family protein [Rugamonas apoptosis]MBA5690442.1 nucleotidyltransferase family protein [Rugamonas apoptosis]
MSVTGILLAAGRGRRFDPSGRRSKLLQPLAGGGTVAEASARNLLAVLPRVVAVVRPGDDTLAAALGALGCEVRVCPDADLGMAASLVHAIDYARGAEGWLIALADMPFVRPATIASLAATVKTVPNGAGIAAPVYQGQRGNPVAFGRGYLPLLLALEGDQGARAILRAHPVCEVAVDDSGVLRDIDTPDDLAPPQAAPEPDQL